MNPSVIVDELQFHAEKVEALGADYTSDFIVYGIYFGEGDPEQGGQHWNFTANSDDEDDEGVCIVKEIQEVTVYGGIELFILTRKSLTCNFNNETAESIKTRRLLITYEINDETWEAVVKQAHKIFAHEVASISFNKLQSEKTIRAWQSSQSAKPLLFSDAILTPAFRFTHTKTES